MLTNISQSADLVVLVLVVLKNLKWSNYWAQAQPYRQCAPPLLFTDTGLRTLPQGSLNLSLQILALASTRANWSWSFRSHHLEKFLNYKGSKLDRETKYKIRLIILAWSSRKFVVTRDDVIAVHQSVILRAFPTRAIRLSSLGVASERLAS